ncbi:MAG: flagellar brake protein [Nitrincola sp.]|nr:flagellar brake protein [Nitrincola sp.]
MPVSDGQLIKSEKEILSILSRLRERATPITIQPDESASQLTTYIESIYPEKQEIVLDSPLPDFRHSLLLNRYLTLTTRYNGCLLTLSDVLMTAIAGDEDKRYRMAVPKAVHLLQRRQAYRAPVRSLLRIEAKLFQGEELVLAGRLKDLSTGGCCIVLDNNQSNLFEDFTKTYLLQLVFPNGDEFSVNAQVVRADYNDASHHTDVGCFFVEISHPQEQFANRVVGDLQRDFIAHSRGNVHEMPALFMPQVSVKKTALEDVVAVEEQVVKGKTPLNQEMNDLLAGQDVLRVWTPAAPVDIKKAYASAETVIKACINHFRIDKGLPIEQAKEACVHLLMAYKQDRQGLLILTRPRHLETYLIEHSVSYAIGFADVVTAQFPEHASDELIEKILLGGLLHNIAQASLPEGLQHYELLVTEQERQQHVDELHRMIRQLEALKTLPHETLCIVRDFHERLDGSGIPNQKRDEELNRVSKMASALYALERLSHIWHQQEWYYHPLHAFKQLIAQPELYHLTSLRALFKQYGKFPLGAAVQLSDQTLALVMRQDDQGYPTYVRVVYDLTFDSLVPPRDILLTESSGIHVERAVNPLKYKIASKLLRLSLKS